MAALQPGERVLDLACGTGLVTFPAAEAVAPGGAVVATDISDAMVEHVTAEASARGLSHVAAARMDAEDLTYPESSFDVVLCSLGLMYVPDARRSLAGMKRVLRPGGRAIVSVWGARSRCGWADIFPIVESRVESDVCPMFFQLGTGDVLRSAMTAAGFSSVQVQRLDTAARIRIGRRRLRRRVCRWSRRPGVFPLRPTHTRRGARGIPAVDRALSLRHRLRHSRRVRRRARRADVTTRQDVRTPVASAFRRKIADACRRRRYGRA